MADPAAAAPAPRRRTGARILIAALIAVGAFVAALLVVALIPVGTSGLGARPAPATSYDDAVARFDAVRTAEDALDVVPDCHSALYTHGHRTERVVVLFHGLTNCPAQMPQLAEQLRQQGANVLVLRAPGHGLANGPHGLDGIDATQFRDYADRSVDIAVGLGDQVTVMGLSMGGMLATWAIVERPEVERAVIIAPAYQLGGYPGPLQYLIGNLFARMPNVAIPSNGEPLGDHAYPQTPTRGVGQMLRLGRYVMDAAAARPPVGREAAFVVNENDTTISNDAVGQVIDEWQRAGVDVRVVDLPARLGLVHDVVDPMQAKQDTALVYPILEDLADGKTPPPVD